MCICAYIFHESEYHYRRRIDKPPYTVVVLILIVVVVLSIIVVVVVVVKLVYRLRRYVICTFYPHTYALRTHIKVY